MEDEMTLQPLGELVLVRPIEAQEKTAGGIFLPDTAREAPAEGNVIAVGAGVTNGVAIGDRVVYKRFAGEELTVEGGKLRLIPVADLLARYVEADAIAD
jgi:chaperonin GroES